MVKDISEAVKDGLAHESGVPIPVGPSTVKELAPIVMKHESQLKELAEAVMALVKQMSQKSKGKEDATA